MSLVEKYWMVTSKISVIALLMITGIYFGKFVCPYIKKKKGAVAVSIVYITIMLVLYMIPPQIDNFSAYLIGVIAAFLAMYVEDRRNIYQKIFLAITFFSIRWLTVAMAARLDDLVTKALVFRNIGAEKVCSYHAELVWNPRTTASLRPSTRSRARGWQLPCSQTR